MYFLYLFQENTVMQMFQCYIILYVFPSFHGYLLLPREEIGIANCMEDIVDYYIPRLNSFVILMPNTDNISHIIKTLSTSINSNIIDMAETFIKSLNDTSKFIFSVQSRSEYINFLLKNNSHFLREPVVVTFFVSTESTALFFRILQLNVEFIVILIFTSLYSEHKNEMVSMMLKSLSEMKVYSVFVVIPNLRNTKSGRKDIKSLSLYSYFSTENCGRFHKAVKLNEWIFEGRGRFLKQKEELPRRMSSNFKNCIIILEPLKIDYNASTEFLRIAELLQLNYWVFVAEKLSLRVRYSYEMRELVPDAYIGTIPLNILDRLPNTNPTQPYQVSHLKWYVPCPERILRHGNFIRVFSYTIWIILFIVVILTGYVIHKLYNNADSSIFLRNFSFTLLNMWGVLTGVSTDNGPTCFKLRIITTAWVWFCFIISTVFQAFFTSFLIDPGMKITISNMEELKKTNIIRAATLVEYSWLLGILEENDILSIVHTHCSFEDCCNFYINNNNISFIAEDSSMNLVCGLYGYQCCVIDEFTVPVYYSFLVLRNSYFVKIISDYVLRITESGFPDQIVRYYSGNLVSNSHKTKTSVLSKSVSTIVQVADDYFPFTLQHLKVAFYLLLIGYLASTITFVWEKVH
ncbi:Ionotropic receptor 693 [Blattella germanica]|nr:Ionotropic receptor 693 [Blattella germanica]